MGGPDVERQGVTTRPTGRCSTGAPDDWDPILAESGATHLEQLAANAAAHLAGEDRHDLDVQGVVYRDLPTSAYRVWCLEQLRARFDELDDAAATTVRTRLEGVGAWEPLWRTGDLASGHDPEGRAPFSSGTRVFPAERPDPVGRLRRRVAAARERSPGR